MTNSELQQFCDFVRIEVGLDFPEKNWGSLKRTLSRAASSHGFKSATELAEWLMETPDFQKRIDVLADFLTIGETFFFRDTKAFDGFERVILPELLESKIGRDNNLRIWSVGCSTGEEPYSFAILLKRTLLTLSNWRIQILATDINRESLKKAIRGFYKEWSFRGAPTWLKKDFFSKVSGGYELDPTIRTMVNFRWLNLVSFDYEHIVRAFAPADVIVCRNTLMYFPADVRSAIIDKMLFWLNDDGWLILSPSEVPHITHKQLKLVTLPGTIFFRKDTKSKVKDRTTFQLIPQTAPVISPDKKKEWWVVDDSTWPQQSLSKVSAPVNPPVQTQATNKDRPAEKMNKARQTFEGSDYRETINILKNLLLTQDLDSSYLGVTNYLLAQSYANLGMLKEAQDSIERAVKADKINASYHHMYASILQARDMLEEASASLQRVLFLDPDHIMAHVTLGTIQQRLDNRIEALRHMRNAMTLLDRLSPEEPVPDSDGTTAGHFRDIVKSSMEKAGANH